MHQLSVFFEISIKKLVGGCLLQSMSITSKTSDPRYKIYMSREVEGGGISVCYLVVQHVGEADSGVYTCKSSHPDSNIYEVSAKVLVHGELPLKYVPVSVPAYYHVGF